MTGFGRFADKRLMAARTKKQTQSRWREVGRPLPIRFQAQQ